MEEIKEKRGQNLPRRVWNEPVRLRASLLTTVATIVILFFIVVLFSTGNAWAWEWEKPKDGRLIDMTCPGEKTKEAQLKLSDSVIYFGVDGCYCANEPESIKRMVVEFNASGRGGFEGIRSIFGPLEIEPGKSLTKTYYCYSTEQMREMLQSDN